MGHWKHKIIFFSLIFTACFCYSNACLIDGSNLGVTLQGWVKDTYRGTFWQNQTTGVEGIHSSSVGGVTNNRAYLSTDIVDSRFHLFTTALFEQYEEYEVSHSMTVSVIYSCTGGTISFLPQTIMVNVIDTNNNPPTFILPPSGEFVFTIAAPMPPGYEITSCLDLTVRDIDLTTEKIIFEIQENPYFEIQKEIYRNPSTPKEFKAILRTKTFIRSFPEEIKLTIWATDYDLTGDAPRTKETTVRFLGNTDFVLPEEPVFSETFYLADYTDDNRVVLTEPITLQSGYDKLVQFNIRGVHSENFELVEDQENKRSIRVIKPLAGDDLEATNIHVIVTADRELTSGASTTVVLRLPEVVPLEFQRAHYEGTIEDNILPVTQLILSQGYADAPVSASVRNAHSSYFSANVQGNSVTLSMTSLDENIIKENSFLNLEVFVTNGRSSATTIVTLEIIKDDNVTPVFNKPIYTGSYDPAGLTLDEIALVQGHDGIDAIDLYGEDKKYFSARLNGATVTIETVGTIPPEIYSRERIVVSLEVRKPRTVGASATIIINLPKARELQFGASTYRGSLQNNELTLDPIPLTVGYDNSVLFNINGDYAEYFRVTNDQNRAIITLERAIPSDNNIVILTLSASGLNAVTTTTSVLLDVIKDDTTTPVFSRNIYHGTYLSTSNFNLEKINLAQGFAGVTFRLDGDHAHYFDYRKEGDDVVVFPRSTIPEEVIFKEKVLVFNILAVKALTVGASAAISIRFPSDLTDRVIMGFSQSTYTGTIGSSGLTADSIVLSSGYAPDTQFILTGEYSVHFRPTPNNNVVSLSLLSPLPIEATENAFILLEIEARRERAVSVWTSVVIEVVRQVIVPPVFAQPYYRGAYNAESGLQFTQVISLSHGYDDSVSFTLDGEFNSLFDVIPRDSNSLSIVAPVPISNEVLQANSQFLFSVVATKPGALAARSAVSIEIEKVILKFAQTTYTGTIGSSGLTADSIVLSSGYAPGTQFILTGEYSVHFRPTPNNNVVSLSLLSPLPIEATENAFILLEIEARREGAVSAWTSVVIEVVRQVIVPPVFAQPYYRGAYNAESGLQFTQVISLSHGYDDSVSFTLDGELNSLFDVIPRDSNSLSIVAPVPISNEVLQANSQFLFSVVATKPGALAARSAVSIEIEKVILKFAQTTYTGTIGSSGLTADSIVLSSGYAPGTQFILTGEYSVHFRPTPNNNVVSLSLLSPLPIEATENAFILLEIEARREGAVSAWTSVVIEVVRQVIVPPVFAQPYYRGAYNAESGLQFTQVISLSHGYDDSVSFTLDGELNSLFDVIPRDSNSLSIVAPVPISNEVLQANSQFLFSVVATKPGALAARSAVSIEIEKDLTDRVILRFAQSTYTGTIGSSGLTADSIVLSSGYAPGTQFILTGEYSVHFRPTPNNNVVSLSLLSPLPIEATENAFILLEIEARREGAVSAWTSVVIEVVRQVIVPPVFAQPYYRGAYNAESGLQFTQVISLSHGYDDSVSFTLDGELNSLFDVIPRDSNSLSIVAPVPISNEVLQANSQFLFSVVATKPGALAARSAVSIDIEKDLTDRVILRFAQSTYTGTIGSSGLTADSIVLSSGYAPGTQFILTGEYSVHFRPTPNNNVVSLSLLSPLPIEATENAFILLEIEARREGAVSAWTSVVIEVVRQVIVPPVFAQPYYRGAYNAESGLQFTQVISLSHGYDDSVSFTLDGELNSLFDVIPRDSNSLSIVAPVPISNEVLQANSQFLFSVVATKPGALAARSAVSIDIEKDLTDRVILRFAQSTYTGTIGSSGLTADSLVLSSGYAPGTQFILTGEYSVHFRPTPNNNVVSLSLLSPLPIEATENAFILLEIEARREGAVSAWTSVVIEVVRQVIVPPVFAQPYYRGAYNAESGLQFTQVISLSHGYDDSVSFTLDGELNSLFDVIPRDSNSLSIVAPVPISNEVLQANSQFLFSVVATKPGALAARSAVSIEIEKDLTDRVILRFAQSTYTGTIGSSGLTADSIVLSSGYAPGTQFILTGEYSVHFRPTPNNNVVSLSLLSPLPIEATENAFILLEIEARREGAVSAWTSVVIEVVRQVIVPPVFAQPYYRGAYNAESGLQFTQVISLSHGYDDSVSFTLDGELNSLFDVIPRDSNSLSIVAPVPISNEVLQANSQFLFSVVATKPGALAARSAVSIEIEKDLTDRVILRFAQSTYTGTIGSSGLTADSIVLSSGYAPGTQFILTGEYSVHFRPTPNNNVVSLSLLSPLPIEATENAFILLEIEARREGAVSAWTSVVIEVVRQVIVPPVFAQPYYRGAYNAESGLQFTQVISLSHGYDDSVSFTLDGELNSLFDVIPRDSNSLSIVAPVPISNEVLQANSQFLFSVVATKPGALAARSAVSIEIEKDLTDRVILRFAQSTYTGTIGSSGLTADSIVLSSGYAPGTQFILTGEYSVHFRPTPNNNVVSLSLLSPLPIEATENAFILLEIEARREGAVSAWTSVVIEVVRQVIVPPVFAQPYYRGAYNAESGLQFTQVISLSHGYDDSVSFTLDGELNSLFDVIPRDSNSLSIVAPVPISNEVLQANSQFLFSVVATKPGALAARSAVSIEIEKDLTDRVILRFAQSTYTGTIGSSGLTADSIVLSSGYAPGTQFILTGEYSVHFRPTPNNNVVSLSLLSPLPIEATENAFILLEIEARREGAVSAWTSVVIEVVRQVIVPPVFAQPYYRGAYNAESGLQFTQVISLSHGYDDSVSFTLDGELNSLFDVIPRDSNSLSIVAPVPISNEVLQANSQFLFSVVATKPGALAARSAVSIEIEKDLTDRVILRFAQSTYTGTIGSSGLTADSIVLSSGYAPGTQFILTGEYSVHFRPTPNNNVVSLSLLSPLPIEATENAFILLEIEARREGAVSAWTSVVIEVVRQVIVPPVFAQPYYRGAYNAESGLQFTQVISLSHGYDDSVSFTLDGELNSLFDVIPRDSNSLSIVAPVPISNEVLQANSQFLFSVVATKPGALAARSAVSIEIENDLTDRVILRFAQSTYTGTIGSSGLTADSIVLSSGYAPGTQFILTGEYSVHFRPTPNNNVVSLSLLSPLPIEATENAFILLEIEARREGAVSAWTSVVIEVVRQVIVPPVFAQPYYRGAYNAESGLQFTQVISLSHGYDDSVSFTLDGELNSLFDVIPRDSNSLSIVAPVPISNEVLQANSQFLFSVVATKPGALAARSAVSIEIEKDLTDRVILRFAQSTYTGTIGSSGLTADSIVLSSGYAPGTQFILTGEYSVHFRPTPNNNVVSLSLLSPLPIEATENAFILLEIEARREGAVSAWTSVVIEVVRQVIVPPVFAQPYYRGAYNAESGLQFTQVISLSHGYDDSVSFTLDGELNSLFDVIPRDSNSLSIVAPVPISNEVLQANSQFLFSVVATKPGALAARSAVSIEIEKDLTDRVILRFAQSTYTGTIGSSGLTADSIVLSSGYAPGTQFILTGEYSVHFRPTPNNNVVSLSLLSPLPIEATENAFILLEIEARREGAVSAWTSVVIEVVRQVIVPPVFAQPYYRGAYNAESGLQFTQVISLSHGYDDSVSFTLDGELNSLFDVIPRDSNSLSIVAPVPISNEVLQANSQFLFSVVATKPGALAARSAVSIEIENDLTDRVILRFAQSTYTGTIGSSGLTADSIVLSSGYAPGTQFILTGEYSVHFRPTPNNNVVSLSLLSPLPIEATENAFILLEIEARREGAVSAWTSVVIEVVRQVIVPPVFAQPYYRGAYNAESGLQFTQVISLSHGYDDSVSFTLDGELNSLFDVIPRDSNSLSIVAPVPISNEVLQANSQFLFSVVATKPGALAARSAVSIEIEKDLTDRVILRFAQSTYTGTIGSSGLTADSIVLSSGYAPGTQFILTGEYSVHFRPTPNNNVVSLSLLSPLPIEATENAFILLEIEARREGAVSAWTSVVIEVVRQVIVPPVFAQPYYRGAYNAESGLQFTQVISLSHGYDDSVSFALDGELNSLFDVIPRDSNSLSIVAPVPISNEVLQANSQFLFSVVATKPGALAARSAVSIEIENDLTDRVILRFAQSTYTGTIGSSGLTADSIVLSSGYAPGTQFILTGEYSVHFRPTPNNNVVSLSLLSPLPIEATENAFILLEIEARREGAVSAWTSVVIEVVRQVIVPPVFAQPYYRGAYNAESGLQFTQVISLSHGYDDSVSFTLDGEFNSLFDVIPRDSNSLSIVAPVPISNEVLQANSQFLFSVVATKPGALAARSAVSIEIEKDLTDQVILKFAQSTYTGTIGSSGLTADSIVLSSGYAPGTQFILTGEYSVHFRPTPNNNVVSLSLLSPLPIEATENAFILLEIEARREGAVSAWTSVVIEVVRQVIVPPVFAQPYYRGAYNAESGLQFTQVISLSHGYDDSVSFTLDGEFNSLFDVIPRDSNSLSIVAPVPISNEVLQANSQFLFSVVATKPGALAARSAVSIEIEKDLTDQVILKFAQSTYTGTIGSSGLTADSIVLSSGYAPGTQFILTGEYSVHFRPTPNNNVVSLSLLSPLPIEATENAFILLEIEARREGAVSAWTSVVIEVVRQVIVPPVFAQPYYRGAYNAESGLQFTQVISLSHGYDDSVSFTLDGDFNSLFDVIPRDSNSLSIVAPVPISNEVLQANSQFLFSVVATKPGALAARSAVSIEIEKDLTDQVILKFAQSTYTGTIGSSGLTADSIVLSSGYAPGTQFILTGEYSVHFRPTPNNNVVSLSLLSPLPIEATENAFILLEIEARREGAVSAWTSVVIEVVRQVIVPPVFAQPYYRGAYNAESGLQFTQVISLSHGYDDSVSFTLDGDFNSLFDVIPRDSNSLSIVAPVPISNEVLQANSQFLFSVVATKPGALAARSAVSIEIEKDVPLGPSVTFSSESYLLSVDMAQTGLVGRVSATAANGEEVTFSLGTDNAHLQTRLSINNEGELYLSAPANNGVYNFEVVATTVITQSTGTALVHLTVKSVMPPLVILERDEESAHSNLVVLDSTQHAGCHFTLTNRWPTDQTWLYVNEFGLHTIAIDREHASIAYMALSQVQVELILHCQSDTNSAIREKRSETTARLGPYDYGSNNWILTDTIPYNSRRSLVNLIVNDINDNDPIFVGKEHEPIVVGYPSDELEERILPRSLAELKATDADIGVNAALRYGSSESVLAVAPTTGFVHVRTGARLTHDQTLTVTATDENGQGRSGHILLMVKLLDLNHIAVVTVRNAFLDDETTVLAQLSDAVGYEVKALRSVVISDDIDGDVTRKKREAGTPRASLQLYVYGINEREPVTVDHLAADISANAAVASVVSTIPLEDHLQEINILDPQIGLLVATIILSVLLFAVIVIVAIWFFLRWRKNKNYDEFNDENGLTSRNASLGELPKPVPEKPRLNIEDLKRSEKRLQEMLQAPIEKVTVEPMPKKTETPVEAILDLPAIEPSASTSAPIVIQSIDKLKDAEESSDDEFGEVSVKPRKSVVTFNENVEKIIHVEDNADDDGDDDDVSINANVDASNSGYEIYRL